MRVLKNLLGDGSKIHAGEIQVSDLLNLMESVIVEEGSNDDGDYIRFGSGRQICWKEYDLTGYNLSNPKDVIFPKEFVAPPTVSHYIYRRVFDTPGVMTSRIGQPAPFSFKHAHQLQAVTAVSGGYIAVGRW